jgi:hypothetical protein
VNARSFLADDLGAPANLARCVCRPRFATARDPDRATLGGELAEVAAALGTPLMPWQRQVADVALEIDRQSGLLVYREVDLLTPRQSGKTTLELAAMVHRARRWAASRLLYSAQSRLHARKKWEYEHVAALKRSAYAPEFTVRYQRGDEAIRWHNGSLHGITAPGETAGHSEVLDLVVMDESWALEDDRLEQGLSPTMITRAEPQQWVVSTAGTLRSRYLREKVEAGRARCTAGAPSNVAYFEWSAPDDADPASPRTWWATMPALGHTVTEARIRGEFERLPLHAFRRGFLNQWIAELGADDWQVIAESTWTATTARVGAELADPVAFAADVTPDRAWSSVAAAGRLDTGESYAEVVGHDRGTAWVVPRLVALAERWRPCAVVVDATGPAGSLIPGLEGAGVEVVKPSAGDAARAAGGLYDLAVTGQLRHSAHPALTAAVAGARKRPLGDAWAWARQGGAVISPLVAATLALWGHATRAPRDAGGPVIYP